MENVPQKNHGRKYRGQPSYAIPVWNGILEHRPKIGPAVWEFLWCLDKITIEDERGIGWLLGKTPIDTKRIASDLNEHENTAYENMNRLAAEGYIIRKRTPRGYAIGVVNSRKFNAFRSKTDPQKSVNHNERDSQKSVTGDSQKSVNQSESDSQKTGEVIHSFGESDSQKTVVRRDTTETLQEDKAVRRDKTVGDKTGGDSTTACPPLVPEVQKLVDELEKLLRDEDSGSSWSLKQTEPRFGPIRGWFEKELRDAGVDFRQIGDLYVSTMSKVRKQLQPQPLEPRLPYTAADLDRFQAQGDLDAEIIRESHALLLFNYPRAIVEFRLGAYEPSEHPFYDPREETILNLPIEKPEQLEHHGTNSA